jgi:hypothetical protein
MFSPYKKKRFATVAIIFAVFFIAPREETFVAVFAIHDTSHTHASAHMLLTLSLLFFFIAERELSLTFQIVVLSSKIFVLFPQDEQRQQTKCCFPSEQNQRNITIFQ